MLVNTGEIYLILFVKLFESYYYLLFVYLKYTNKFSQNTFRKSAQNRICKESLQTEFSQTNFHKQTFTNFFKCFHLLMSDNVFLNILNTLHINDLNLLCEHFKCHNLYQLILCLENIPQNQKAEFSNSQIAFYDYLPQIVLQAWNRNDQFGMLSQNFMELLNNQMQQIKEKGKMTKQELKNFAVPLTKLQSDYAIYEKLVKIFTEATDKDWLIDRYINGGIKLIEDINSRAKPAIKDFYNFVKQGYLSGNLSQYQTLEELEDAVEPFQSKKELVDKGTSNVVYQDSKFKIVELLDEKAACYYGQATKWCTAATKGDNLFNHYRKDGPIFTVLVKKPSYQGEKYQFRYFPEFFIADETDKEIKLEKFLEMYPNLKPVLEKIYIKLINNTHNFDFLKNKQKLETDNIILVNYLNKHYEMDNEQLVYIKNYMFPQHIQTNKFISFNKTQIIYKYNDTHILYINNNTAEILENTDITINDLSHSFENLTHLVIWDRIRYSIEDLPVTLTHLIFKNKYYKNIDFLKQLPQLTHLEFTEIDKTIDYLPQTLKYLKLGNEFYQHVSILPRHLTYLEFSYSCIFNDTVDDLPDTLTHLIFGYAFNKSVDKLPATLTHLTFGYNFNQSVDKLPATLTHLTFGHKFNQSIENLPNNITHLSLDDNFTKEIHKLPAKLKELKVAFTYPFTNQLKQQFPHINIHT